MRQQSGKPHEACDIRRPGHGHRVYVDRCRRGPSGDIPAHSPTLRWFARLSRCIRVKPFLRFLTDVGLQLLTLRRVILPLANQANEDAKVVRILRRLLGKTEPTERRLLGQVLVVHQRCSPKSL